MMLLGKKPGVKVITNHPEEPSNSSWGISGWTKVVAFPSRAASTAKKKKYHRGQTQKNQIQNSTAHCDELVAFGGAAQ